MESIQSDFWADFDSDNSKTKSKRLAPGVYKFTPILTRTRTKKPQECVQPLLLELKSTKKIAQSEIDSVYNTERKATIESVRDSLNSLKEGFTIQIADAKEQNLKMIGQLNDQSKMISILAEYLNDFEFHLTQNRIYRIPEEPKINQEKVDALKEDLNKDMEMTKLKILSLKEGIKRYTLQTENTNKKLQEMQNFLVNCRVKYEKEIKDFEIQGLEKIKQEKEINAKLRQDFEFFKKDKLGELDYIEKKCGTNEAMIQALRDELKAAKEVLNYPVLKLRVHDKLQGYLDELKIPSKIKQKNQAVLRVKPMSVSQEVSFDFNYKLGNEEFSPFVSKLNLSSRKTSSTGTRTKLSKSIQILNSFDIMSSIRMSRADV